MLDPKVSGKLLIGKGAVVQMESNSGLAVKIGSLFVNDKWGSSDPSKSFLYLMHDSRLVVEGNFSIFSGARVYVHPGAVLNIRGGYANHGLDIDCYQSISIGKNVAIGPNVSIRDSDNKSLVPGQAVVHKSVDIGDDVWIGTSVRILKGVRIGNGAVVAAGSVVVQDVPDHALVAGVPAKVIREDVRWH